MDISLMEARGSVIAALLTTALIGPNVLASCRALSTSAGFVISHATRLNRPSALPELFSSS